MYNILWEFYVKAGNEKEFEQHYGNEGIWVKLFRTGKGYIGSHLFRDVSNSLRYLTLDQWENAEDFETFEKEQKDEYSSIDKICEKLTDREIRLSSWVSGRS